MNYAYSNPVVGFKAFNGPSEPGSGTETKKLGDDYRRMLSFFTRRTHRPVSFIVSRDEDGVYVAEGADDSIVTQGNTMEELQANIRSALICHFGKNAISEVRLELADESVSGALLLRV